LLRRLHRALFSLYGPFLPSVCPFPPPPLLFPPFLQPGSLNSYKYQMLLMRKKNECDASQRQKVLDIDDQWEFVARSAFKTGLLRRPECFA